MAPVVQWYTRHWLQMLTHYVQQPVLYLITLYLCKCDFRPILHQDCVCILSLVSILHNYPTFAITFQIIVSLSYKKARSREYRVHILFSGGCIMYKICSYYTVYSLVQMPGTQYNLLLFRCNYFHCVFDSNNWEQFNIIDEISQCVNSNIDFCF